MTLVKERPVEALAPGFQVLLPHVQAALENLLTKFRKDPSYHKADSRTTELFMEQLVKQGVGLQLLPSEGNAAVGAAQARATADSREPRRVTYTQRETNGLLKNALVSRWPDTRFFFRSNLGVTTIFYLAGEDAPPVAEVEGVALGYEGVTPKGAHDRECIWHPRTGEDGYPELVSYGTNYMTIAAVTADGPMRGRKDGLTHLCTVFPLNLRAQLLG